ncbi:hypothetical protein GOV08_03855 [Candidatus Woesearchaeota archaeon]|nr:hypothetical protein [Candidatus Woesearchaeota archaeon]
MELTRAEDHNSFYLGDKKVMDLKELYDALIDSANEETAKSHLTDTRNDYSDWIKEVLKDEELAANISDKKEISEIAQAVKEKLDSLGAGDALEKPPVDVQPVAATEAPPEQNGEAKSAAGGEPVQTEQSSTETSTAPDSAQPSDGPHEQTETAQQPTVEQPQEQPKQEGAPPEQQPIENQGEQSQAPLEQTKEQSTPQEPAQPTEATQPSAAETAPPEQKPAVSTDATLGTQPQTATQVAKQAGDARHFCPKFFECMKKEFLFGLLIGIVVGIVAALLLKMGF